MSDQKPVVLVPGKIHPRVLERFQGKVEVVTAPVGAKPALSAEVAERVRAVAVSGSVNADWIDGLPNLEIISNFGVGYDGVDAKHAAKRGIIVTNTPDVLNDEVADTTIALLINTVRRLYQAESYLRDGKWVKEGPFALSPFRCAVARSASSAWAASARKSPSASSPSRWRSAITRAASATSCPTPITPR